MEMKMSFYSILLVSTFAHFKIYVSIIFFGVFEVFLGGVGINKVPPRIGILV
jgi:hypothetical protein